jgi:NADPH:quinone reductase-like Zn-dependent oxidoreductase
LFLAKDGTVILVDLKEDMEYLVCFHFLVRIHTYSVAHECIVFCNLINSIFWHEKGTWGEYVAVDKEDVVPCPSHLSVSQAAAFPLAGLTAYRYSA